MNFICRLFGHNYSLTSTFGNYAFCSKCGATLVIKEPYDLSIGERRYKHGVLMEMTELGLEKVTYDEVPTSDSVGEYSVEARDPHE